MAITPPELALLADVVRRRSGLALPPGKQDLVRSKLAPVAVRFGFRKLSAMLAELAEEPEELAAAVTEAMTTNETSFFRDPHCFAHFRDRILPALVAARAKKRRLRIWCAAASTGQEAYSLAMLLDEAGLAAEGWKIDLFATDLSSEAIARAQAGIYAQYEVQRGLTIEALLQHFVPDGQMWRVSDRLRRSLRLKPFNLLDSYGWLGEIDVIFCRNVLIYFDHQAKLETLARLDKCLAPDGRLVLGATESAFDSAGAFAPADAVRGVYVKAGSVAGRHARLAG